MVEKGNGIEVILLYIISKNKAILGSQLEVSETHSASPPSYINCFDVQLTKNFQPI